MAPPGLCVPRAVFLACDAPVERAEVFAMSLTHTAEMGSLIVFYWFSKVLRCMGTISDFGLRLSSCRKNCQNVLFSSARTHSVVLQAPNCVRQSQFVHLSDSPPSQLACFAARNCKGRLAGGQGLTSSFGPTAAPACRGDLGNSLAGQHIATAYRTTRGLLSWEGKPPVEGRNLGFRVSADGRPPRLSLEFAGRAARRIGKGSRQDCPESPERAAAPRTTEGCLDPRDVV